MTALITKGGAMFFPEYKIKPTMTLTQSAIYEGIAFRFFHQFDIPASGDYLISVKNGARAIHLFSRLIKANLPDVSYEVRTGATITGYVGNELEIFNMNSYSSTETKNTIQLCTASDLGQLTDLAPLGGTELTGNRLEGDESIDPEDIKILPDNTEFLLRVVNPNTDPAKGFLYLKWFETARLG